MQVTGMKYGAAILKLAEFPVSEILGSGTTLEALDKLIQKRGKCVVKPVFNGGVGKKGKAGLVKIVSSTFSLVTASGQLASIAKIKIGRT